MDAPAAASAVAAPQQLVQAYPPPPAFFRLYRPDADGSAERPLPPTPPAPPAKGEYVAFGVTESVETGVPPLGAQQLYRTRADGSIDFKEELVALSRELVFGYAELVGALAERPGGWAGPAQGLALALRNAHHLLNLLRPHQARATLEETLRVELADKQQALRCVREEVARADQILQQFAEALDSG